MFLFSFQYKIYIIFMQNTTASSFLLLSLSFSLKSLPLYLFTSPLPLSFFPPSLSISLSCTLHSSLSCSLSLLLSLSLLHLLSLSLSLKTITQVLDDELIRAQNIWVNTDKEIDQLFVTQQVTTFNIVKISPFIKKAV